eukprot:PhM_4_TR15957/c0_g1_i1/m.102859/K19673/TTC21B, IFT139; tetratricopeptide repeat protein 21B
MSAVNPSAASPREYFALMHLAIRDKLWNTARVIAAQGHRTLSGSSGVTIFSFWTALCVEMEGNSAAAAKEYKNAEVCPDVRVAAYTAELMLLRRGKMIDPEAVDDLENKISQEDANMTPSSLLQLALLHMYQGEYSKAREVANRAIGMDAAFANEVTTAQNVRAWVDLSCGRSAFVDKSIQMFQRVLEADPKDLEAFLGTIQYYSRVGRHTEAIEGLTQAIVTFPVASTSLMILKAKAYLACGQWEQAWDTAQRVHTEDSKNIHALYLLALHFLVRESKFTTAASMLTELVAALEANEPTNATLFLVYSQAFARLSSNNLQILTITTSMLDRALKIAPHNAAVLTEFGYQNVLRSDYKTAQSYFTKGSQSDEGATGPLMGSVRCSIMTGRLDEAERQLEFLNEIQSPLGRSAELLLLTAMLTWRKYNDSQKAVAYLVEAMEAMEATMQSLTPGLDMYITCSPHVLTDIARELMQFCRGNESSSSSSVGGGGHSGTDPIAERTHHCLELLVRIVPGTVQGLLLTAQIAFLTGNYDKAHSAIVQCIRQDNTCAEAHLLAAQIAFHQENYTTANTSLEQALCLDFEVRDMPLYCFLKGTVLSGLREYQEAIKTLQHALDGVKLIRQGRGKQSHMLTVAQHASTYIELAQVYVRLRNHDEANRVIFEAANEVKNTSEEGHVAMVQAMIVARKDVDMALSMLRSIPNTSPYFLKAKAQMAHLYLTQRHNRREFARCYEELVEAYPSVSSYTFLGEAYLNIQEPEKAIAALEKARTMDPHDADLAGKIGRALMITHDYQRALRYYRESVAAEPSRWALRHDLAGLYTRLGDFDKAIAVLREGLDYMKAQPGVDDIGSSTDKVHTMILLARIHRKMGDTKAITDALVQARVYQNTVLNKLRGESSDTIYRQRGVAANICYDLGQTYTQQGQTEKALSLFNEALKFEETNDKAMLALANLYLDRNELDGCEQQCNALLRVVPGHESATVMLADIMYRKSRYDDATFHYQSLLERRPNNYDALVRYIKLLRHCGKLGDAKKFFSNIDKTAAAAKASDEKQRGQNSSSIKSPTAASAPPPTTSAVASARLDPGLHYAKGLYYRYTNEPQNALKELHLGRHPRENPYAERCVLNMVDIYLNPDNENIWEDTGEVEVSENVRTAEKLLGDIPDRNKRALYTAYVLIATKRKENLEKALTKFYELMAQDGAQAAQINNNNNKPNNNNINNDDGGDGDDKASPSGQEGRGEKINVACLVGMATALQLMKQTAKARNHLRRVAKAQYSADDADHFERGWLMLADIYIEGGKFDLAQDLLKRTLQMNKSCGRAWEFMGLIYEKEQSYNDASECYECAWKLVNEHDPGIGYKLAFNYLKAKRYVNAIDVCTKVLAQHPKYPKIRKDVLDKARALIRP